MPLQRGSAPHEKQGANDTKTVKNGRIDYNFQQPGRRLCNALGLLIFLLLILLRVLAFFLLGHFRLVFFSTFVAQWVPPCTNLHTRCSATAVRNRRLENEQRLCPQFHDNDILSYLSTKHSKIVSHADRTTPILYFISQDEIIVLFNKTEMAR